MLKRHFLFFKSKILQNCKYSLKALSELSQTKQEKDWNVEDYLIGKEWRNLLEHEFKKNYVIEINKKLKEDYNRNTIYPPSDLIFHALNLTQLSQVIILIRLYRNVATKSRQTFSIFIS